MDPQDPRHDTDELNALVDGQLAGRAAGRALLARLAGDPLAQDTIAGLAGPARGACAACTGRCWTSPCPPPCWPRRSGCSMRRERLDQWWRWGGMAAGVVLAFGVGWLSHGQIGHRGRPQAALARRRVRPRPLSTRPRWRMRCMRPKCGTRWKSRPRSRSTWCSGCPNAWASPLKVPVLAAQGYELVGGRLLPGEGGARAQFMFQNRGGRAHHPLPGRAGRQRGTAAAGHAKPLFATATTGRCPAFYWVDQGFGYALSGAVSREELMQLAELVYRQL